MSAAEVQENVVGIVRFLAAMWGDGPHSLCWSTDTGFRHRFVSEPHELLAQLDDLQDTDVWVGAHPLIGIPEQGRGSGADVAKVVAIPADLDWAHETRRTSDPLPTETEVRQSLRLLGPDLQPSIVVHSGHGLQPWWLLRRPVTPDEAEVLIDQLAAALTEVDLANGREDLASILRLPGTRNHKDPAEIVPVVIESMDVDRRFTPEHLRKHLPPPLPGRSSGGGTRHRPGMVTDDQQALLDLIVSRHGGNSPHFNGDGSIYVWRPGKSPKDGQHSASIITGGEGDALLTVYSDHWPEIGPVRPGLPRSWVLGIDGELHHPDDELAKFTMNVPPTSNGSVPAVVEPEPDEPEEPDEDEDDGVLRLVDWSKVGAPVDHLVDGVAGAGLWTQFVAPAKGGKSTLLVAMSVELSEGRDPFDGTTIEPVIVLYADGEMAPTDIGELIEACGHDPGALGRLHVADELPRLDEAAEAARLLACVDQIGARVVVLDGLNGFIDPRAPEKDDTPWRQLYKHTIVPLKRRGVTIMSGDNMGKDRSKGARGSSVKADKADVVFELAKLDRGIRLHPSHRRARFTGADVVLEVVGIDRSVPIRFRRSTNDWLPGTKDTALLLDRLGVPTSEGRDKVRVRLRKAIAAAEARGLDPSECHVGTDVLAAALRYRRQPPRNPSVETP